MNHISAIKTISEKIYHVRGSQVMIDSEIAHLYGVETKVFNQARSYALTTPENFGFKCSFPWANTSINEEIISLNNSRRNL